MVAAAALVWAYREDMFHADQVLITGDIRRDWVIRTRDLDAHAREPINVRYVSNRCQEVHQVRGVPLHDILARVTLCCDSDRKMDRLNFAVIAHAEDGYRVLLSWAEVDPEFGACAALLATRYNGQTLTLPILVLPHDARASRYVRRLRRVQLVRLAVGSS
jgi:hypothetical protein